MYIILAATVGALIILIIAFGMYNNITGAQVVTIEDLHEQNIEGNLDEDEGYLYNGLSFVYADGLWYSEIKRENKLVIVTLHFGPRDVEDVIVSGELDDLFKKEEMHITFDPFLSNKYTTLAASELSSNIAMGIGFKPVAACDKNQTDACKDRPIVTCEDRDKAVIYIIQNEEGPRVEFDRNCVKLIGTEMNLVKALSRFLYMWYQVMD